MKRRLSILALVLLSLGLLVGDRSRASIRESPVEYSTLWAILLDPAGGEAAASAALGRMLSDRLGLEPSRVIVLSGVAATRAEVRRLLESVRGRASAKDGLILYIAPPLNRDGGKVFLPTSDADPKAPWSGVDLREIFSWVYSLPVAATAVLFPSCAGDARSEEYLFSEARYARGQVSPVEFVMVCDFIAEKLAAGGAALPDERRESFTGALAAELAKIGSGPFEEPLERLAQEAAGGLSGVELRVARFPGSYSPAFRLRRAGANLEDLERLYRDAEGVEGRIALLPRLLAGAVAMGKESDGIAFLGRVAADPAAGLAGALSPQECLKVRLVAVEELGRSTSPAVADLLGALARQADDPNVRRSALSQLTRRPAPQAQDLVALRATLSDPDAGVREAALQAVGLLRDVGAAPALARLLESEPEARVRVAALQALSALERPEDAKLFILAAEDRAPEVRRAAIDALGRAAPSSEAQAVLLAHLSRPGEDDGVREAAAYALGRKGTTGVTPAAVLRGLEEAAAKGTDAVRRMVAVSLGRLGGAEAERALRRLLRPDREESVRVAAAEALGKLRSTSSLAELVETAGDPSAAVRRASVAALGRLGGERAIEVLFARLDDRDSYVRQEAERALVSLPQLPLETLLRQAAAKAPEARRLAIRRLGEDRQVKAVPALVAMLRDADGALRLELVSSLALFDDAESARALQAAAKDKEVGIRLGAVDVLGILDQPWTTAALVQSAGDADTTVRAEAVKSLGLKKDDRAALTAILSAAQDPYPAVRTAAARALANRQEESAEKVLRLLLEDPLLEVRQAARAALFGPEQKRY